MHPRIFDPNRNGQASAKKPSPGWCERNLFVVLVVVLVLVGAHSLVSSVNHLIKMQVLLEALP